MKSEKGSITLFTLVAMMFLLIIAFTAYTSAMIKLQAQNAEIDQIVANYSKDLNAESLATLYENLTKPEIRKASQYTCIDGVYCNSPELIGFNQTCTYYVTYDESGNEKIEDKSIAEMEAPPPNWYSYREKRWANIVTINNGNKTYWVWIPRFKYKTPNEDSSLPAKTTDVKFTGFDENGNEICYSIIDGNETPVDVSSYKQSKAFEFNGKQLKGYWVSKYRVQEGDTSNSDTSVANIEVDVSGFNPDVTKYVTYDNSGNAYEGSNIRIGSDGTAQNKPNDWYDYKNKKWANIVTENNGNKTYWTYIPRYEYQTTAWKYLMPEVKFIRSTDSAQNGYKLSKAFEFNGKQLKGYWVSKYRVQEGDNSASDASLANIEVDVSGFNPDVTKFVTYDNSGNETIGNNIQIATDGTAQNKPQDWYDYKNKKWANIVTENNGLKAYWTYIPRYEYQITAWKYLMPEVKFMKNTDGAEAGFKISNAFEFFGKQLRGYWVSKYRVQDNTNNTEFNGAYYNRSN